MARIIIGLAGEIGSGKSHSAKYLVEKYGAASYRFSSAGRDVVRRLYLPETREMITKISVTLRQALGDDLFSRVIAHDAAESQADIVVVDGVRRQPDIEHLKALPNFKFVYIEATPENRYARLSKRGENADDNGKTWEQFKKDHELPTEVGIPALRSLASVVINNDGSIEELEQKLDELVVN